MVEGLSERTWSKLSLKGSQCVSRYGGQNKNKEQESNVVFSYHLKGSHYYSLETNAIETSKDFLRFVTSLYLLSLLVFFFFFFPVVIKSKPLKPKEPLWLSWGKTRKRK